MRVAGQRVRPRSPAAGSLGWGRWGGGCPALICSPCTDLTSSLCPTFAVPLPRLYLGGAGELTQGGTSWSITCTQGHGSRPPLRSPVVSGAPQSLHPATQGKRNWCRSRVQRTRMKTTQRRPAPLQGLQAQDSHERGRGARFPLAGSQSTPINNPILPHQLTS